MSLEVIYEDKNIIVYYDGKGWDFTYDIENKTDNTIFIKFTDYDEHLEIKDWVGLFSDQKYMIEDILAGKYEIF
jgi:hypothetical protein